MNDQLKNNFLSTSLWLRIFYMIIFYVVSKVVVFLILLITVVSTLGKLVTGQLIQPIYNFSHGLNLYLLQIIEFLTFRIEDKPFPFSDWPKDNNSFKEDSINEKKTFSQNNTPKDT